MAIAELFFGDMDKMRKTIKQMLNEKEIPIVKLFDWLLPPKQHGRNTDHTPSTIIL